MKINNAHFKKLLKIVVSAAAAILFLAGCNGRKQEAIGENEYYVCSMDPQVMEKQPGSCPICKMPLTKTTIDKTQLQFISLNASQMQLGNIKIDTAQYSFIGRENTLTGTFTIDQNKTTQVSSRIAGRIEQLYHKVIGEQVKTGDKLYDLYSREMLLAQEEYILAIEKSKVLNENSGFMNAAKNKLLLGGLNERQVNELEITKQAKVTNTIYSKTSGTITEIALKEGDYVNEGTMIYKIADLSSLWVEAQLYTNELGYLEEGKKVEIIADAYPDEQIDGTIIFVNPELQQQSKINLVRAEVNNSRMLFKPGMQAYVVLKSENKRSIVIPSDAVLKNAAENIVWVLHEKTAAPDLQFKFEPRSVTIGLQTKNKSEIISGLRQGDQVVVSGAYLLNSEYIFKRGAAPNEMNAGEMPGMKM